MNRIGMAMTVGLAALLSASLALADTRTLATSGSWSAFGGTTSKGRGVCGISGSPSGLYFGVKLFAGNDTFTIQMQVPRIENGSKVAVTLRFDSNPLWHATGTGFHFDDGDAGLEFTVRRAEADRFVYEFKNSSTLVVQADSGAFPRWVMGLEGTLAVSDAFQSCMRGLPTS